MTMPLQHLAGQQGDQYQQAMGQANFQMHHPSILQQHHELQQHHLQQQQQQQDIRAQFHPEQYTSNPHNPYGHPGQNNMGLYDPSMIKTEPGTVGGGADTSMLNLGQNNNLAHSRTSSDASSAGGGALNAPQTQSTLQNMTHTSATLTPSTSANHTPASTTSDPAGDDAGEGSSSGVNAPALASSSTPNTTATATVNNAIDNTHSTNLDHPNTNGHNTPNPNDDVDGSSSLLTPTGD
ncbi:MAG: hypothetical protein BYD32DRAFT_411136, partial [Podila humilis]